MDDELSSSEQKQSMNSIATHQKTTRIADAGK